MSGISPAYTPIRHDELAVRQDRSLASSPTRQALINTSSQTRSTSFASYQVAKSVKALQSCSVFDLDAPHLPLHAAQRPTDELAGELVCRFRAIHTPPHLCRPIDWGVFGEVIVDTPSHLHINVKFEHLHMMNAIKQAWVNTHIKPDTECVLRLGEPVLDEARELHVQEKSQDLIEALFPQREVPEVLVGECSSPCTSQCKGRSPSAAPTREVFVVQFADCDSPKRLNKNKSTAEEVRTPTMINIGTQTEGMVDLSDIRISRLEARKAKDARSVVAQQLTGLIPAGSQSAKVKLGIPQKKKSWAQIVSRH